MSDNEVKCEACNGTGRPPAEKPQPGKRIYPPPCKVCGGKGWIPKAEWTVEIYTGEKYNFQA
jgi:hypothetical protein